MTESVWAVVIIIIVLGLNVLFGLFASPLYQQTGTRRSEAELHARWHTRRWYTPLKPHRQQFWARRIMELDTLTAAGFLFYFITEIVNMSAPSALLPPFLGMVATFSPVAWLMPRYY